VPNAGARKEEKRMMKKWSGKEKVPVAG